VSQKLGLILRNSINWNFIKILMLILQRLRGSYAFDARVDEGDLFLDGERGVLSLLQEFLETFTTIEGLFCGGVEVGTELGKGGDFTVLS
jgi:hypothetical protein